VDHLPGQPDPVRVFFTTYPTPFRDAHELIGSVTHDRMFDVTTVAVDPAPTSADGQRHGRGLRPVPGRPRPPSPEHLHDKDAGW
jgi:hypothetical protein